MTFKQPHKVVRFATITAIIYLLCFGCAMAIFPIRAFWNDEWRLLYNIKFKSIHGLWGRLDLLQQCPRVYLTVLKLVTSAFDYSYISIRSPALALGIMSIFLLFHLRKKLFTGNTIYSYLFVLILISSQTFTDYLTQIKHYEMDIFLSLLCLWQLITLLDILKNGVGNAGRYALLCISLAVAPFFSYIYPIAIAPIFPVLGGVALMKIKNKEQRHIAATVLPLLIVAAGIVVFYMVDVRQLMADSDMYNSYLRMLGNAKGDHRYLTDFWNFFALVGSGALYEIIFGVVGIAAFVYGVYKLYKKESSGFSAQDEQRMYGLVLIVLTLLLIFAGKLMGSVARLAAFTVPSIALLIADGLEDLKERFALTKISGVLFAVVFIGLLGNVVSTCINSFTYVEYNDRIHIYWRDCEALKAARKAKVPMLYTDGMRGDAIIHPTPPPAPGTVQTNMITPAQKWGEDRLCTEVILKVNPEYKGSDTIALYMVPDIKWTKDYVNQLPPQYHRAMACDGQTFFIQNRQ